MKWPKVVKNFPEPNVSDSNDMFCVTDIPKTQSNTQMYAVYKDYKNQGKP